MPNEYFGNKIINKNCVKLVNLLKFTTISIKRNVTFFGEIPIY